MSHSASTSPEMAGGSVPRQSEYTVQLRMAGRLIDRAIQMFFDGEDPLFVLAIANPGHVLFHDIARVTSSGNNTAARLVEHFKTIGVVTHTGRPVEAISDLLEVLRRDANSLKHIAVSPSVSDDSVIATLILGASDAQDLHVLTATQLIFVMWSHARQPAGMPQWELAASTFPTLRELTETEQRQLGKELLSDTKVMNHLTEELANIQREGKQPK